MCNVMPLDWITLWYTSLVRERVKQADAQTHPHLYTHSIFSHKQTWCIRYRLPPVYQHLASVNISQGHGGDHSTVRAPVDLVLNGEISRSINKGIQPTLIGKMIQNSILASKLGWELFFVLFCATEEFSTWADSVLQYQMRTENS